MAESEPILDTHTPQGIAGAVIRVSNRMPNLVDAFYFAAKPGRKKEEFYSQKFPTTIRAMSMRAREVLLPAFELQVEEASELIGRNIKNIAALLAETCGFSAFVLDEKVQAKLDLPKPNNPTVMRIAYPDQIEEYQFTESGLTALRDKSMKMMYVLGTVYPRLRTH